MTVENIVAFNCFSRNKHDDTAWWIAGVHQDTELSPEIKGMVGLPVDLAVGKLAEESRYLVYRAKILEMYPILDIGTLENPCLTHIRVSPAGNFKWWIYNHETQLYEYSENVNGLPSGAKAFRWAIKIAIEYSVMKTNKKNKEEIIW